MADKFFNFHAVFFRLNFHTYLPDVIRDANDDVETHIVEPLEPPDVRKSRQLTLDNMKLHRELEKMKQGERILPTQINIHTTPQLFTHTFMKKNRQTEISIKKN